MESERYSVYELDGNGERNYIAWVEATSEEAAQERANEVYGAPVEVEEQ